MTLNQKEAILKYFDELNQLDIVEIANEKKITAFGNFTIEDFDSKLKRVIKQFKNEFNTPYYEVMNNYYSAPVEHQVVLGNLESDFDSLKTYLSHAGNSQDAANVLSRLIFYQILYGFWDKSTRKLHNADSVNALELSDKVTALEKQLKQKLSTLDVEKKNVSDFLELKQKEVAQISQNTQLTNQSTSTISDLLTTSSKNEGQIEQIFKNIQEKQVEIEKLKTETQSHLTELQKQEKYYEVLVSDYQSHLTEIDRKKDYFDQKNKELEELIGKEASSGLFKTFNARKDELNGSVKFWIWAVPIAVAAVGGWVWFLFQDFNQIPVTERWIFLIINSIKTIPALFLLVFVIKQYVRERNFQEEYAFKSAVSLTILAYSHQLKDEINKDKMIMDSVTNVYDSPIPKKHVKDTEGLPTDKIAEELKKALEKYMPDILKSK